MGHQTMLNPELEDHTGGDLGYLNSLFNRLFCFGQEPTPDIRNNIVSNIWSWFLTKTKLYI